MKYHFIIFAIGLVLGLFFSHMYHAFYDNVPPIAITKESPKKLEAQVSKNEVVYSKTFDSLKKQSVKLQIDLKDTKAVLNKVTQRNYSLQVQVFDLLDKHFEKQQQEGSHIDATCDSLASTVGELMQTSNEKDSLYEQASLNLEEQIKNKDSTIAVKDQQYQEIKEAFTKSNEGWTTTLNENKKLSKQAKSQKFKSKILSAALLIFAGAATNYLIQH
jgi:hypothetical protein